MSSTPWGLRVAALAATGALVLAACGGGDSDNGADSTGDAGGGDSSAEGQAGGTLYWLTQGEQLQHLDPQRNYTGEDLAFANAYLHRTLVAYTPDPDPEVQGRLTPDLATDLGTPNADSTEWTFTLRDDATWEDGAPVTCEDVKYGISRTFALDVITDGPTFAIERLNIPTDDDGSSQYKGPYTGEGQELYDEAVSCDGQDITFKLNGPYADWNYTLTLLAFSPVRQDADTGEQYTDAPLSNGPYKIEEYAKGQQLVLTRNENWNPDSDPIRPAYPDEVVVQFSLDGSAIDQRLIADAGDDQYAFSTGIQPANLPQVFTDDPRFNDRRWDEFDIYTSYFGINTILVPNLKHRQAIAAAFNRENYVTVLGGEFAGEVADGVIKPGVLELDYEPTGLWDGLLGQPIPEQGDAEFAQQLIEESGEEMPNLTVDYPNSETRAKEASAFIEAMQAAGIPVTPNPIEPGTYYGTILNPDAQGHIQWLGWGPDWANASTVIPPLFSSAGAYNLSRYNQEGGVQDEEFQAAIDAALVETDREAQAEMWKELNTRAVELALVVPTVFTKEQRLWGSGLGGVYYFAPYGSFGYMDMYVEQ